MERHHVSLMVVMFLVVLCVSQCIAQVNFSPNWGGGKRSADPPDECRSSMDSLKYIYKLIQVNNRVKPKNCMNVKNSISKTDA
ncbi:hypertrehalosaemic prohormone-like isoform X1 [Diaphorina citri]|uniref:Hypertrehalosaemic prohormone-like isoform X1 n=1 Tax=Diaphorina citri TaxID=121845 RepID=A0A3Q0IIP7_DIACI|nr:hypertrehalosaemic prohormone-like isoform X1 [Diaphorina citri]